MRIALGSAGEVGVVSDLPAIDLPLNAWSRVENVRMKEACAEKALGYASAYSIDPTVAPYAVFPYKGPASVLWVYAGLAKLKVMDGTSESDITRVAGDYTGTATDKWTGGRLGDILIVNNGVDDPQQWGGSTGTPAADLSNWPASTTCGVMRPFKNFLVAGNIVKSGTSYPYMVKWSTAADPGAVPSTWDETDATALAGEKDLPAEGGDVVDFRTLSGVNFVYKQGSIIAMRLVGGIFVFDFDDVLTRELGVFCVNAVQNFTGRDHRRRSFVLGTDDVIVHDGRSLQSVIDERNRRRLFDSIDPNNIANCFVAAHEGRKEMWLCYPSQNSTWCDKAFIWNWMDGSWGEQDLPDLAHMDFGFFDPNLTAPTYSNVGTETYAATTRRYNDTFFNPAARELIGASPANTELYQMDIGETFDGAAVDIVLERTGWGFILDRYGKPVPNKTIRKLITEIWPHFEGSGTVQIYVGGQETAEGPISWSGPFPFEIGVDDKINPWKSAPLIAFRIQGSLSQSVRLVEMEIELKSTGSKGW